MPDPRKVPKHEEEPDDPLEHEPGDKDIPEPEPEPEPQPHKEVA